MLDGQCLIKLAFSKYQTFDFFHSGFMKLFGTFCDCERCRQYKERAEAEKYLPPEELKSPKCPGCGRNVHHGKELIYLTAKVAKKVLEQEIDQTIKIKSAFCCSCHSKYSRVFKQKKELQDAPEGSTIFYKGKEHTIYYDEDGIKFVGKTRMSEFLNKKDSHTATIVRPEDSS